MGIVPADFPTPHLPMGTFLDVPVQRGVVRAASTLGNLQPDRFHDGFKAYVYRGTGFDTLTPDLDDYPAKPKPRKRKPKKRKPQSEWMRNKQAARQEARYRIGDRRHPEHHLYYRSHPQPLGPEPEPDPFEFLETEPEPPSRPPARPAPGWKPTTGTDIDAWMDEYGV